jgi:hypothetical protein
MIASGTLALLFAAVGLPTAQLLPSQNISLSERTIRLGDVARAGDLSAASWAILAERPIARIPRNRTSFTISREGVAALVRRTIPGLALDGRALPETITFQLRERSIFTAPPCYGLSRAVAAGSLIEQDDIGPTPCAPDQTASRVRYDRSVAALRAVVDLPEGSLLGRVVLPSESRIERGTGLTLVATIGPVRVEREVVAVQDGRAGRSMFVRDADGQVISGSFAGGPSQ